MFTDVVALRGSSRDARANGIVHISMRVPLKIREKRRQTVGDRSDTSRRSPLGSLSSGSLPVRACALELAQQPVAALDGGIERRLRGLPAAEGLLQFVVDHVAYQDEGTEPQPARILGRRLQGD